MTLMSFSLLKILQNRFKVGALKEIITNQTAMCNCMNVK